MRMQSTLSTMVSLTAAAFTDDMQSIPSLQEPAMISPGQTVENPVTGERFTFTDTAASSGGELLAFDFGLRPGGAVPIPHVHPIQTERFEVVEGRMTFRIGRRKIEAAPGDVVEVAPGVAHSFANAGDDEARMRVEVRPALAMEEMFAEVVSMAQAGRMNRRGMPRNLLELAVLARKYDQEAHAPLLSVRVQRLLLAPLVFLARHRRVGRTAALAGTAAAVAGVSGIA
jgi:quercetin dioxygenase-like cupin family protein